MFIPKSNLSKSMLLLTAALVAACSGDNNSPGASIPVIPKDPVGGPINPAPVIPDGVWIQKGFGRALSVSGETLQSYAYTRETCLNDRSLTQAELAEILTVETVGAEEFIATEDSGILIFSKRDSLPPACLDGRFINEYGPVSTLNHVIHNFSDYYPFFELRGITDWDDRVRNARLQVNHQTTEEELALALIDLLTGLNDSHVTLSAGDEFQFTPGSSAGKILDVLVAGFENQSEIADVNEYIEIQFQRIETIRNSYFDPGSLQSAGGDEEEIFQWATMGNGTVGYIEVRSMYGIADGTSENDLAATEDLMDHILTEFANTEALIINVLSNDGGDLSIGDAIANRFLTETLTVSSYQVVSFDDSAEPQPLPLVHRELAPTERVAYGRPIATISGPNTYSSAEHFLMTMRALKHPVCFIGERSDGVLSAVLDKELPTETWRLGLSNQISFDHTGQSFEAVGIPVDIEAVTFEVVDAGAERNKAIDAALIALGFGYFANSSAPAADCAFSDARVRLQLEASNQ